jgi:hypothetical protein
MTSLEIKGPIELEEPTLVLAIGGWVDGGQVASKIGEHLAGLGELAAEFRADAIFDYQSHRPTLELVAGTTADLVFPSLTLHAVSLDGADLLVLAGIEPNFHWQGVASELATLADSIGVRRIVSVGAVPAMVAHTLPSPIIVTSSDPGLEPAGMPAERLVVPAALVNVLAHHIATANTIPDVGFWAQVPHYVSAAFWPAVEAVLTRMTSYLGVDLVDDLTRARARDLLARLDEAVASSPDAQRFVAEMEASTPEFAIDESSGLTDEIEAFLRSLGNGDKG